MGNPQPAPVILTNPGKSKKRRRAFLKEKQKPCKYHRKRDLGSGAPVRRAGKLFISIINRLLKNPHTAFL